MDLADRGLLMLRALALAASAFLGFAWWSQDPGTVQGITGGIAFLGLAASVLVRGLWRGFWVELLAVLGALLLVMTHEALMLGVALTIPALFFLVVRQWRRLQLNLLGDAQ